MRRSRPLCHIFVKEQVKSFIFFFEASEYLYFKGRYGHFFVLGKTEKWGGAPLLESMPLLERIRYMLLSNTHLIHTVFSPIVAHSLIVAPPLFFSCAKCKNGHNFFNNRDILMFQKRNEPLDLLFHKIIPQGSPTLHIY